jgi:hypothetical protein
MIKAEDLRIGDIVRINENDSIKNGLIGKVTDIDSLREYKEKKGAITLNTIEDDGWYWGIWCCNIEPIPLTPEILEKNGWERDKLVTYIYGHDAHNIEVICTPNSEWMYVTFKGDIHTQDKVRPRAPAHTLGTGLGRKSKDINQI